MTQSIMLFSVKTLVAEECQIQLQTECPTCVCEVSPWQHFCQESW